MEPQMMIVVYQIAKQLPARDPLYTPISDSVAPTKLKTKELTLKKS